jgi:transposase
MTIKEDKIGQSWLFPPCISDFIPQDHICNLVVSVGETVDVSEAEEKYRSKPGNPAYPRRMLLRLMVQASIDGIWSSRKIDKLAHENVIYMYLAGNEKPDFRTICNFRKENKELIEKTFKLTVTIARRLGILQLGHLSTDGTKVKANASNNYTLSKEEIEELRAIIEKGIAVDEEEDKLYGDKRGDELPPDLDTREKIRKKIEEIERSMNKKLKRAAKHIIEQYSAGDEEQKKKILKKVKKAEEEIKKSGQKAVSLSDPEARFMENKKKRKELSYNPQITVDHGSGIIVANDVTQDCTDQDQLQPQVEKTEKNLEGLPEGVKMSLDNGYFSGPNLRYLEEKELDGYIPDSKQAQTMKGKKPKDSPYSKDKFEYNEEKDLFVCPHGEALTRRGTYEYKGRSVYTYYGAKCSRCPFCSECTGKNILRVITSDGYEVERRRMAAKMRSKEGKEEYKKRKETVEWPFGDIKQNLKVREFLTRGIENVRVEHNMVCTAHNLKVMWNKLKRDMTALGKIGNLDRFRECKTRTHIHASIELVTNLASKAWSFLEVFPIINSSMCCWD